MFPCLYALGSYLYILLNHVIISDLWVMQHFSIPANIQPSYCSLTQFLSGLIIAMSTSWQSNVRLQRTCSMSTAESWMDFITDPLCNTNISRATIRTMSSGTIVIYGCSTFSIHSNMMALAIHTWSDVHENNPKDKMEIMTNKHSIAGVFEKKQCWMVNNSDYKAYLFSAICLFPIIDCFCSIQL